MLPGAVGSACLAGVLTAWNPTGATGEGAGPGVKGRLVEVDGRQAEILQLKCDFDFQRPPEGFRGGSESASGVVDHDGRPVERSHQLGPDLGAHQARQVNRAPRAERSVGGLARGVRRPRRTEAVRK